MNERSRLAFILAVVFLSGASSAVAGGPPAFPVKVISWFGGRPSIGWHAAWPGSWRSARDRAWLATALVLLLLAGVGTRPIFGAAHGRIEWANAYALDASGKLR
jgi:hypothetical protein